MTKKEALKICKDNNVVLFDKLDIICDSSQKLEKYVIFTKDVYTDGCYVYFHSFCSKIARRFKVLCFIYSNEIVAKSPFEDKWWLTCHEKWVAIVAAKLEEKGEGKK